jgi:hypothetical protein
MGAHTNFGGNQTWRSRTHRPGSDQEVLGILQRHAHEQIRPMGSAHSWSNIAACAGVSLDMAAFDEVHAHETGGEKRVRVGAGCTLQRLLERLHAAGDQTLPTLGVIKRQTIAGAISTGTHGSGRQSLSHFVAGARVAAYDGAGQPQIFEYRDGDALRAVRCGLACTGIILSVDLRTVPKYRVEEKLVLHKTLGEVLGRYADWPLTQFSLLPYGWDYLVFERRQLHAGPIGYKALLFRWYNAVWVDRFIHQCIRLSAWLGSRAVKALLRTAPWFLIKGVSRIDDAEQVLTMGHDLFRHEEMELFVPESRLTDVVEILRVAIEVFAGGDAPVSAPIEAKLRALGLYDELLRLRGSYTLHYPLFFRRVLADDTLISMTASTTEPYYSVGVFSYFPPQKRNAYYAFCGWLARCMFALAGARLHWGKNFPLGFAETARMYPRMEAFRQFCVQRDPAGVFRNTYTERVLGLAPGRVQYIARQA